MNPKKQIAYAYSSSPLAVQFKCRNIGCYLVELKTVGKPPKVVAGGFVSRLDAVAHAQAMPQEWADGICRGCGEFKVYQYTVGLCPKCQDGGKEKAR